MPCCQWSQFGLDSVAGFSNTYRQPDFRPGGEAALHADEFFQRDVDLVLLVDDALLIKVILTYSFYLWILITKAYWSVFWVRKMLMSKYGL